MNACEQQELLSTFKGMEDVKGYDGSAMQALQGMHRQCCIVQISIIDAVLVNSTLAKCDHDVKREMSTNMVLTGTCLQAVPPCPPLVTGGTSLFLGAKERLEREINDLSALPSKVKVMCPVNTAERRFSVWIGTLRLCQTCV